MEKSAKIYGILLRHMRTSEEEAKSIRRVAWRSRELGW
jgi:hypothetical protein